MFSNGESRTEVIWPDYNRSIIIDIIDFQGAQITLKRKAFVLLKFKNLEKRVVFRRDKQ